MTSIKWNGREVRNPFARAAMSAGGAVVGVVFALVATVVIVVCIAIVGPLHPIFRAFGRKGCFRKDGQFIFDGTSFDRD